MWHIHWQCCYENTGSTKYTVTFFLLWSTSVYIVFNLHFNLLLTVDLAGIHHSPLFKANLTLFNQASLIYVIRIAELSLLLARTVQVFCCCTDLSRHSYHLKNIKYITIWADSVENLKRTEFKRRHSTRSSDIF